MVLKIEEHNLESGTDWFSVCTYMCVCVILCKCVCDRVHRCVFNTFKVVRRLIRRRSYVLQVKCIYLGKLVWVMLFCGGQGREIVTFYRK